MKVKFLENIPQAIAPLIKLALKLGITYKEFNELIKLEFISQARKIIEEENSKITNAAISMVSGIDRTAVTAAVKRKFKNKKQKWISHSARVTAEWISLDLGTIIPYSSKEGRTDFVTLAKGVTTDKSPRTILDELIRLGRATIDNDKNVHLLLFSDNKSADNKAELLTDFADNIKLHSLAGVNDLLSKERAIFLEQAIKVDGIHLASAKDLSDLASVVWRKASKEFINEAKPISKKEEKEDGKHKLSFGVYCYYE